MDKSKSRVAYMFDNIAPKYDLLNHTLSLHIDKVWRKRLVKYVKQLKPESILDIATGTGDLAIACTKAKPKQIIGVDISEEMLKIGIEKIVKKQLTNIITLQYGDSEDLQFDDKTFDVVTVAFGVRNFENLVKGLSEMCRVLKPGGSALILEFTIPRNKIIKFFYKFYLTKILPIIGKIVSKHSHAYTYLPDTVQAFPQYDKMLSIMSSSGFNEVTYRTLTFGIATIYIGKKTEI